MKSRPVTNDVSVRDRKKYIMFVIFTLNGIVKPNPNEASILYFS